MEKILIVDDSMFETKLLEDILKDRYEICTARTGEDGIRKAKEENPVLILLDIIMPCMDGFAILKCLKDQEETKDIPVIFLTGLSEEQMEEQGLLMGAVDYIRKPYNTGIVKARVQSQVKMYLDRKLLEGQLSIDSLTGIYNRRCFDQKIVMEWKQAIEQGTQLSFVMIDIDYFKKINDTYGHLEGDYILRQVADTIKTVYHQEGCYAFRYGGEEFAVLQIEMNQEQAIETAKQLLKSIYDLNIPNIKADGTLRLTISIGGSTMNPTDKDSYELLIRQADQALYEAKSDGRNCICWK